MLLLFFYSRELSTLGIDGEKKGGKAQKFHLFQRPKLEFIGCQR